MVEHLRLQRDRIAELEERLRWRKWDEEKPEPHDLVVMTDKTGRIWHAAGVSACIKPSKTAWWRPLDPPGQS